MSYRKARTKHDKIKLMTYIQYIQQFCREKKEQKQKQKLNVYQLQNRMDDLGFEFRRGQVYLCSKTSNPTLLPTQPHIHWIPGVLSPGRQG